MATPQRIKSIVSNIERFNKNIAYISFKPESRVPRFKPGQFLHLALDNYDGISEWPESRVFSIASPPKIKDTEISIIVSAKGPFTSRVVNSLKKNDIVWLKLPYGDFTIQETEKTIVLVAGGTGIAPFVPFLEQAVYDNNNSTIRLYYGVKNKNLIIFNKLLEKCIKSLSDFKSILFAENIEPPFNNMIKGIIDKEKIFNDNKHNADYYLSGPLEMIMSLKDFFISKGVLNNNIHIDSWN